MEISQHPFNQPEIGTGAVAPAPIYALAALVFSATLAYAAATWDADRAARATPHPAGATTPALAIDWLMARADLPIASDPDVGSGFVEFEPPPSEPRGMPLQAPATEHVHESTKQARRSAELAGE
jgi:hypothetical protein